MVVQGNSQGSGSYLGGGRVLTAAHVVQSNAAVVVYFENQRIGSALIVRRDTQRDLALLSISGLEGLGARPLEWRDSGTLREGDELLALGYPEGLPFSVKVGVVSGLRTVGATDLIQTDASLNPGMSGGPVLDASGRLVGVTDFGYLGAVGLNFAVASSTARVFADGR
jgi:putative serine protease PepD